MLSASALGVVVGFIGAILTLGIPLGKVLADTRRDARQAVRLLTGEEEIEGDGVLPRLRDVELRSVEHRLALRDSTIELPDLDGEERRERYADGGRVDD